MTLSITLLYIECHYAESRDLFIVVLTVIVLKVVMLSVVILSVIMLSVIMLIVIMLSVVFLSVVIECRYAECRGTDEVSASNTLNFFPTIPFKICRKFYTPNLY
jgi:hypothetical protein